MPKNCENICAQPNPYLFEIEKSKKKLCLAHDFGAGARCLRCLDKCTGFELHFWRKTCKNCQCNKESHDIIEKDDPGILRIGKLFDRPLRTKEEELSTQLSLNDPCDPSHTKKIMTFDWVPPGISESLIRKYMEQLPYDKLPISGSNGSINRKQQLIKQIPFHDMDISQCHNLTESEKNYMQKYLDNIKQHVVGIGSIHEYVVNNEDIKCTEVSCNQNISLQNSPKSVKNKERLLVDNSNKQKNWKCYGCQQVLNRGEVAIFAERAGKDKCWHPACFTCCICKELLMDLIYFYHNGNIFCGRHFPENINIARCKACDELIFTKEYTHAEGHDWHLHHFCCWSCDSPLGGHNYIAKDDLPYCLDCYQQKFGKVRYSKQIQKIFLTGMPHLQKYYSS